MNSTVAEILKFIEENDVKFIRLAFCDIFGRTKNISIMPHELENAFLYGVPFDAYSIDGFTGILYDDLFLFPEASTIEVLPWRPNEGGVVRFYCEIKTHEGLPFWGDTRALLKTAIEKLRSFGYTSKVGAECEFYLFKTDENGEPIMVTQDNGSYLDVSPLDKGENIRREICLCLEDMGILPLSSHHEKGPGQNEIDFKYIDTLVCADNLCTLKTVAKAIAQRNGLFASFLPKPLEEHSGSGLHLNLSLFKNGKNIFKNQEDGHSQIAESFIAGILSKTAEITAFLNPLPNSYDRLGTSGAPKYISWSHQNRSQLLRIPPSKSEEVRLELRSPDPSINPYLALYLILSAGIYGIEKSLTLPPSFDRELTENDQNDLKNLDKLPENLTIALEKAVNSEFIREVLSENLLLKYNELKLEEIQKLENASDKKSWLFGNYFKVI